MHPIVYYIIQFVLGGASVVGISLVAKYLNPKYAGIIYAVPVIIIVAMIFVYLDEGMEISRKTLKSTFIYEFTLIWFIFAFYFLMSRVNFWWAIVAALVSWAVIATAIQFFIKA